MLIEYMCIWMSFNVLFVYLMFWKVKWLYTSQLKVKGERARMQHDSARLGMTQQHPMSFTTRQYLLWPS